MPINAESLTINNGVIPDNSSQVGKILGLVLPLGSLVIMLIIYAVFAYTDMDINIGGFGGGSEAVRQEPTQREMREMSSMR